MYGHEFLWEHPVTRRPLTPLPWHLWPVSRVTRLSLLMWPAKIITASRALCGCPPIDTNMWGSPLITWSSSLFYSCLQDLLLPTVFIFSFFLLRTCVCVCARAFCCTCVFVWKWKWERGKDRIKEGSKKRKLVYTGCRAHLMFWSSSGVESNSVPKKLNSNQTK